MSSKDLHPTPCSSLAAVYIHFLINDSYMYPSSLIWPLACHPAGVSVTSHKEYFLHGVNPNAGKYHTRMGIIIFK